MINKDVLLVVGDTLSKITNPKDRSTGILFGDAASATIISERKGKKFFFDLI